MRKLGSVSTVVLGMIVTACGGGSSGFSTGVPGSKPLGTLTPAEAKTLCMNTFAYLNKQLSSPAFLDQQCRALGIAFAGLNPNATSDVQVQQACTAGYALCQASLAGDAGAPQLGGDAGADPCTSATIPPTCNATADQYAACVNESFSAQNSAIPPCNQLTVAKLKMLLATDGGTTTMSGPACTAFEAACPGLNTAMSALRAMRP